MSIDRVGPGGRCGLALAGLALLAACAGADVRYDRPIRLEGRIDAIASCTMQKLEEAGYGPPGLTYVPVTSQPRSYIIYRSVPSFAPAVGLQLLRIDLEQLGRDRAEARLTTGAIAGGPVAQAAVPALLACQGSGAAATAS
jgi:hypothetical protein